MYHITFIDGSDDVAEEVLKRSPHFATLLSHPSLETQTQTLSINLSKDLGLTYFDLFEYDPFTLVSEFCPNLPTEDSRSLWNFGLENLDSFIIDVFEIFNVKLIGMIKRSWFAGLVERFKTQRTLAIDRLFYSLAYAITNSPDFVSLGEGRFDVYYKFLNSLRESRVLDLEVVVPLGFAFLMKDPKLEATSFLIKGLFPPNELKNLSALPFHWFDTREFTESIGNLTNLLTIVGQLKQLPNITSINIGSGPFTSLYEEMSPDGEFRRSMELDRMLSGYTEQIGLWVPHLRALQIPVECDLSLFPELETLVLERCSPKMIDQINAHPRLKVLRILPSEEDENGESESMSFALTNPHLEEVFLDNHYKASVVLDSIKMLPSLRDLTISGNDGEEDDDETKTKIYENFKHLHVRKLHLFTVSCELNFLENIQELEEFEIHNSLEITDDLISHLHLRKLTITDCQNITSEIFTFPSLEIVITNSLEPNSPEQWVKFTSSPSKFDYFERSTIFRNEYRRKTPELEALE